MEFLNGLNDLNGLNGLNIFTIRKPKYKYWISFFKPYSLIHFKTIQSNTLPDVKPYVMDKTPLEYPDQPDKIILHREYYLQVYTHHGFPIQLKKPIKYSSFGFWQLESQIVLCYGFCHILKKSGKYETKSINHFEDVNPRRPIYVLPINYDRVQLEWLRIELNAIKERLNNYFGIK